MMQNFHLVCIPAPCCAVMELSRSIWFQNHPNCNRSPSPAALHQLILTNFYSTKCPDSEGCYLYYESTITSNYKQQWLTVTHKWGNYWKPNVMSAISWLRDHMVIHDTAWETVETIVAENPFKPNFLPLFFMSNIVCLHDGDFTLHKREISPES